MLPFNDQLSPYKKRLRNNMTNAEAKLWIRIKNDQLGARFNRQKIIGNYIVDFYCHKLKLVIEIDGLHHYNDKETIEKDKKRDEYLKSLGLTILRFDNITIHKNSDGVAEYIYDFIKNLNKIEQIVVYSCH